MSIRHFFIKGARRYSLRAPFAIRLQLYLLLLRLHDGYILQLFYFAEAT